VCTGNVVRIDLVRESRNVGGNGHAAALLFEVADVAVPVD
jgi:hypothetical protein